ncbi:6-dehydratase FlaA1 and capsular polysaccharide biosynthesis protein EpsC (FlaA1) (PDB:2GN4) [Commensalibacter communis]|uniref:Includes UDP-GlcNAc-inverting 4 n=1 Tax=Commensalibacter communis TaxID=2972786 RepID=A0A9W4TPU2_9PROT|nr:nucleoside-diphosphate sugar epimerase/dehydratase [Commensalibacter communis]CAI3923125.1 6-dehydratase FlaA1 and capsular polysaccharide biosynthesis protein EpsC (FlaA1) (PDB:2GN4) [Commensalibacter communis]CAI3923662.1 6-dehydratase FlaA1 and capsular polysaccharide biosynthesis protein EpsC (FlaA1) (PDB:2GN4) [Commensalibacter communis]CAI3945504.1 6-dehydratase FlaA1 and capsular polysaccharide biosynthesis protein EpsC (FlaA1) (PDB:2GN4) [Commensalibacter communis]CAI3946994.1 6-dehy
MRTLQQSNLSPATKQTKRYNRIVINIVMDAILAAIAAPLARWLSDPQGGLLHPLWFLASGVLTLLVSGLPFHIPQQYWRFSGIADLLNIAAASIASSVLFTCLLLVTGFSTPSVTFPIIYALVLLVLMGGGRVGYRLFTSENIKLNRQKKQKILLLGTDEDIDLFIRATKRDVQNSLYVVGLISFRQSRKGHRIHNAPILGNFDELPDVLSNLNQQNKLPSILVITGGELRGPQLRKLLSIAENWKIQVQRTPSLTNLSPASNVELQPIALEELLNRPQVPLDQEGMELMIRDRVIVVTGAGGSIGSELVRQISRLSPKLLILLDHSEYALWKINVELAEWKLQGERKLVLANIRDKARIQAVFQYYKPELVFHAAALKHVPMIENNPIEGFLTNIIGTRIIANAAAEASVKALIMISTDKAVNPSSLMGTSKRIAEMYCQALDMTIHHEPEKIQNMLNIPTGHMMRCVTVRFGNVLGSTGSVVPLFRRQLRSGGPLTVTDPEMKRYFMTVPEAVGLVLQASVRATVQKDGDIATDEMLRNGGIFVLDMGEPVKILDLARQLIRLAGLKPDEDIQIEFTGLRPGEKLFEELFHGREAPMPTDHAGLMMATPRTVNLQEVNDLINQIAEACQREDIDKAISIVQQLVPEFQHKLNVN